MDGIVRKPLIFRHSREILLMTLDGEGSQEVVVQVLFDLERKLAESTPMNPILPKPPSGFL